MPTRLRISQRGRLLGRKALLGTNGSGARTFVPTGGAGSFETQLCTPPREPADTMHPWMRRGIKVCTPALITSWTQDELRHGPTHMISEMGGYPLSRSVCMFHVKRDCLPQGLPDPTRWKAALPAELRRPTASDMDGATTHISAYALQIPPASAPTTRTQDSTRDAPPRQQPTSARRKAPLRFVRQRATDLLFHVKRDGTDPPPYPCPGAKSAMSSIHHQSGVSSKHLSIARSLFMAVAPSTRRPPASGARFVSTNVYSPHPVAGKHAHTHADSRSGAVVPEGKGVRSPQARRRRIH